jgi:hypothetical protein
MPATLYTESSQPTVPLTPLGPPALGSPALGPSALYGAEPFTNAACAPLAPPSRSGASWVLTALFAVGGVLAVCSLFVVIAIWWAVNSFEGWMVGLGREGIVAMVEESNIPADEQREVKEQVDRVVAAYKAGKVKQEDLNRLLLDLDSSPAMAYISCAGIEEYYLEDCDLPPDVAVRVRAAFGRAVYGVSQGTVDVEDYYAALPDDEEFDNALSESDEGASALMQKSIDRMQKLADRAGVPADPPAVDIGGEMKRVVDQLLAGK